MYKQNHQANRPAISNLVPGFAFYEGIGDRLAECLIDFFEAVADWIGRFRT